jgi:hypothetical protein
VAVVAVGIVVVVGIVVDVVVGATVVDVTCSDDRAALGVLPAELHAETASRTTSSRRLIGP